MPQASHHPAPLRLAVGAFRKRLRERPDSEHEMILNRVVIAALVLGYLLVAAQLHPGAAREPLIVATVFAGFAAGFLVHLLVRPGQSVGRRLLAMSVDLCALSYGMHVGEGVTALLYPLYLWTIFGNGFRFGLKYLFIAVALSVAGFGVVLYETQYWRDNLALGAGLLGGLVILPLYAAKLIRTLSEAKLEAEKASRAKSMFLASISHELRTPLNAVIGMGDLLAETPLDVEQRNMVGTIGTAARALLALINQVLDLSRIEAGRMPTRTTHFDLHVLLGQVKGMVEAQARAKGLQLGVHVTPGTSYRLSGDARHLQDILINLVSNAVKFTASGSVLIRVEQLKATETGACLRFEVSDTGIGIGPEAIGRIFESFTQADETIVDNFGGTGLGLAICKQLAEMLGGDIGVESEPGRGSTFWLDVEFRTNPSEGEMPDVYGLHILVISEDPALAPMVEDFMSGTGAVVQATREPGDLNRRTALSDRALILVDERFAGWQGLLNEVTRPLGLSIALLRVVAGDQALSRQLATQFISALILPPDRTAIRAIANLAAGLAPERSAIADVVAKSQMKPLSVLVAEDNVVNQKVISKILERGGHQVTVVDDGEQAVDTLLAQPFDIVLMDINMPVMNGIEATKLYRFAALGRTRIPIVALTADATPEARARCMEAGMDECLLKPVQVAELYKVLQQLTEGSGQHQGVARLPEGVSEIAAHPKFQAETRPVLDRGTISSLQDLGGADFVGELAREFTEEGSRIVAELKQSVEQSDVYLFRDRLHALRSSAANVGGLALYEMCLGLRSYEAGEFESHGWVRVAEIESEFGRLRKALAEIALEPDNSPVREPASVTRLPLRAPA
jgi:two-component system sensor histidine kinase RpfC